MVTVTQLQYQKKHQSTLGLALKTFRPSTKARSTSRTSGVTLTTMTNSIFQGTFYSPQRKMTYKSKKNRVLDLTLELSRLTSPSSSPLTSQTSRAWEAQYMFRYLRKYLFPTLTTASRKRDR